MLVYKSSSCNYFHVVKCALLEIKLTGDAMVTELELSDGLRGKRKETAELFWSLCSKSDIS
jgi:hypothetical protein